MPDPLFVLLSGVTLILTPLAMGHAMLNKRKASSAGTWVFVCLVFPLLGSVLYYIFGMDRVRARAARLLREDRRRRTSGFSGPMHGGPRHDTPPGIIGSDHIAFAWQNMAQVGEAVTSRPLAAGNSMDVLHNGEEAYPAMLAAIAGARRYVFLSTYIFEAKGIGADFIEALAAAQARGVDVRVLVDGVGGFYSRPNIRNALLERGVRAEWFLRPSLRKPSFSLNLRNHAKLLVVDGEAAFTGGMNIRNQHIVAGNADSRRIQDIQFRFVGPVTAQLQESFLEDWGFVTGEYACPYQVATAAEGGLLCRTVSVGPDYEENRLANLLSALVSSARDQVWIMTPYFMPPRTLMGALESASLRGVDVSVILPGKNNLPYMHWAGRNIVAELLEFGISIYYQPPPFCHSKLLLIDDYYLQVGSANLDARSLALNFECCVEVFGNKPVESLGTFFEDVRAKSRRVEVGELVRRPVWENLRDSFFWMFKPYL